MGVLFMDSEPSTFDLILNHAEGTFGGLLMIAFATLSTYAALFYILTSWRQASPRRAHLTALVSFIGAGGTLTGIALLTPSDVTIMVFLSTLLGLLALSGLSVLIACYQGRWRTAVLIVVPLFACLGLWLLRSTIATCGCPDLDLVV